MASNYPPGVTGNEYAIAGPDYEKELDIPCPACGAEAVIEQGYQGDRWMFCLECDQTFDLDPPLGTNADGREVGYRVDGVCEAEGCDAEIDLGLGYACGNMPDGGAYGCGKYFCYDHLNIGLAPEQLCTPCEELYLEDHPEEAESTTLPIVGPEGC